MYSDINKDDLSSFDRDFYITQAHKLRSAYINEQMGKLVKAIKNILTIDLPVFCSGPLAHK